MLSFLGHLLTAGEDGRVKAEDILFHVPSKTAVTNFDRKEWLKRQAKEAALSGAKQAGHYAASEGLKATGGPSCIASGPSHMIERLRTTVYSLLVLRCPTNIFLSGGNRMGP